MNSWSFILNSKDSLVDVVYKWSNGAGVASHVAMSSILHVKTNASLEWQFSSLLVHSPSWALVWMYSVFVCVGVPRVWHCRSLKIKKCFIIKMDKSAGAWRSSSLLHEHWYEKTDYMKATGGGWWQSLASSTLLYKSNHKQDWMILYIPLYTPPVTGPTPLRKVFKPIPPKAQLLWFERQKMCYRSHWSVSPVFFIHCWINLFPISGTTGWLERPCVWTQCANIHFLWLRGNVCFLTA